MSSASTAGGDGGEDEARKIEARKIEARKIKDAERSRKRRADKKAKDEAESKKMKAMEVRMAEMEKSLESKDVEIAATKASYQSLVAENQRLVAENTVMRNSALKKNADQIIWDEVGDDQFEREKVLLDLEQECLEKVLPKKS